MKHAYVINGDRIIMVPLEQEDIEPLRNLRNREKEWFLSNDFITKEQQKEWYERYLLQNDDIMFKIVFKEKSEIFCGAIAVYNIDIEKKVCEIGRTLVDKNLITEKRIGQEATKAVCKFSLVSLGIERIRAKILKSNRRSLKIHLNVGFYMVEDHDCDTYTVELTGQSLMM